MGAIWSLYRLCRNTCLSLYCQKDATGCNNSCQTCENCSDLGQVAECLYKSSLCGATQYNDKEGMVGLGMPVPSGSLCVWSIDLRSYVRDISSWELTISLNSTVLPT